MKIVHLSYQYLMKSRLYARMKEHYTIIADEYSTVYPIMTSIIDGTSKKVLIVTPHADDETFGMGGTIAQHVQNGDEVQVVVVSDNSDSVSDWTDPQAELVRLREQEMLCAMKVLGAERTEFLGLPPARFTKNACPDVLKRHIIEIQPDLLYLPFWSDNHRDHRILNHWTSQALRTIKTPQPKIRMFEVWSPLPATMLVDITQSMDAKLRAMECFSTQLRAIQYDRHISGLNAYRAMTTGDRSILFCEAFCEISTPQFLDVIKN